MNNPTTVGSMAQVPRETERRGGKTVPYTRMYPLIKGGQCDRCGTLDSNMPATYQYKLCEHFRGMGDLECSYCDPTKDPQEVIRYSVMKVHDHPYDKDALGRPRLVVVCDSYECGTKHETRFDVSR